MRKFVGFFFVFGFILAVPVLKLHAQSGFEGTITWAVSIPQLGDDEKHDMKLNIKGDMLESELDLGAMGLAKSFVDPSAKKVYSVMMAMKSGRVTDLQSDSSRKASESGVVLTPTGKKDTIAGHAASEYTFKDGGGDVSVSACSGFPKNLSGLGDQLMKDQQDGKMQGALNKLSKMGLFPVKVVVTKDGEEQMSMEFVKYEEKKLDDALFVAPTDIKYQSQPKTGGGGTN